jgi:hypothetical protein
MRRITLGVSVSAYPRPMKLRQTLFFFAIVFSRDR